MAVLSALGDVKIVSPISTFALDALTLKVHFFLVSSVVQASKIVTRIDVGNLILEKNDSRETFPQWKPTQYSGGDARQVITH